MYEVNNTYNTYTPFTTSSTFGRSSYTRAAEANNRAAQSSYRIGQNCIISSNVQQPHLAEVKQLNSLNVGASSVYGEEATYSTMRRVGGNDHLPDPYLNTPVGDTPIAWMAVLLIGYLFARKWQKRSFFKNFMCKIKRFC